jgi:hypothetical protein
MPAVEASACDAVDRGPSTSSSCLRSFELQPHLVGELLELRPLRPDDWDALFQVASDPLMQATLRRVTQRQ